LLEHFLRLFQHFSGSGIGHDCPRSTRGVEVVDFSASLGQRCGSPLEHFGSGRNPALEGRPRFLSSRSNAHNELFVEPNTLLGRRDGQARNLPPRRQLGSTHRARSPEL
jgi:hypothetical protein